MLLKSYLLMSIALLASLGSLLGCNPLNRELPLEQLQISNSSLPVLPANELRLLVSSYLGASQCLHQIEVANEANRQANDITVESSNSLRQSPNTRVSNSNRFIQIPDAVDLLSTVPANQELARDFLSDFSVDQIREVFPGNRIEDLQASRPRGPNLVLPGVASSRCPANPVGVYESTMTQYANRIADYFWRAGASRFNEGLQMIAGTYLAFPTHRKAMNRLVESFLSVYDSRAPRINDPYTAFVEELSNRSMHVWMFTFLSAASVSIANARLAISQRTPLFWRVRATINATQVPPRFIDLTTGYRLVKTAFSELNLHSLKNILLTEMMSTAWVGFDAYVSERGRLATINEYSRFLNPSSVFNATVSKLTRMLNAQVFAYYLAFSLPADRESSLRTAVPPIGSTAYKCRLPEQVLASGSIRAQHYSVQQLSALNSKLGSCRIKVMDLCNEIAELALHHPSQAEQLTEMKNRCDGISRTISLFNNEISAQATEMQIL